MAELIELRRKHAEFGAALDTLRRTADEMESGTRLELWDRLTATVGFLVHDLLPYTSVEDEILYPALAAASETSTPIDVLRAEHVEIARMTGELDEARRSLPLGENGAWTNLRRLLYGLHAVARLHFTVEDEIVLPLLESDLDARDAEEIADAMRAVVHNTMLSPAYQA
ncbi:hemerythrin domain-containing protein [Actinopolymorpha alba]|uniref:hemerythrin domain-containing protein n=1 Tax=Actinopolymorpha alba TaxID=533267 RepID=UPI000372A4C0|nr:hemerythrin domain-containing protein [Actinopolymorpha alba]